MANHATTSASKACCGSTCCKSEPIPQSVAPFGEFQVRTAMDSDHDAVSALLSASNLAALDPASQFGPQYVVAHDAKDRLVGVAGL